MGWKWRRKKRTKTGAGKAERESCFRLVPGFDEGLWVDVDEMVRVLMAKDLERYIPVFSEVIKEPREVWLQPRRRSDGKVILRRLYLKFYQPPAGMEAFAAVVEADHEGGRWFASDYHLATSFEETDSFRRGSLLWPEMDED